MTLQDVNIAQEPPQSMLAVVEGNNKLLEKILEFTQQLQYMRSAESPELLEVGGPRWWGP